MFSAENHPYRATSHYGARVYSGSRGKVSDFTQRIMSAKLLRVKELRNQLAVTQHQLNVCTTIYITILLYEAFSL